MTKLPVISILKNSFFFVNNNFRQGMLAAMPYALLFLSIHFLMTFSFDGMKELPPAVTIFSILLYVVLYLIFYAAMIIAWHRAYLMGVSDQNRVNLLRMKRSEWELVGKIVQLALVSILVTAVAVFLCVIGAGIIGFLFGMAYDMAMGTKYVTLIAMGLGFIGIIVGLVIAIGACLRYMLYFPAKATGGYISFRESFALTEGMSVRLAVLYALPVMLAGCVSYVSTKILTHLFHREDMAMAQNILREAKQVKPLPGGDAVYVTGDGTVKKLSDTISFKPDFTPEGMLEFFMGAIPTILLPIYLALIFITCLSQTYKWVMENRR